MKIWLGFLFTTLILFSQQATAGNSMETAGDVGVSLLSLAAWGSTFYMDDKAGRLQLYKGFVANLAVTEVLKRSVQRERPNKHDNKSFPSGHTSVSFQAATFIYQRYGWKSGIPAYLTASFVGYSRIKTNWHYATDVLAGAAVGALSSLYFTDQYNENVQLMPIVDAGTYGIAINTRW